MKFKFGELRKSELMEVLSIICSKRRNGNIYQLLHYYHVYSHFDKQSKANIAACLMELIFKAAKKNKNALPNGHITRQFKRP